ncbi:MAG: phosphate ABC transporter substrate-binding protein PstS [Actinomycetes bacterium]
MTPRSRPPAGLTALAVVALVTLATFGPGGAAQAQQGYKRVSGAGSTWSANAIQQWIANVRQYGMTVDYADTGSSDGRAQYANGTVDFAVSEIPFGMRDGASSEPIPSRPFAYMPIVAGGTSFMYNLRIGGQQVKSLRLSGEVIAKIFTGQVTQWNDPAIQKDNPGLRMPATRIVPVVRSDGSGTSAQFTAWMLNRHSGIYNAFCQKVGRNPCTQTSNYPVPPGSSFVSKSGSNGVSGFVRQAQSEGAITYVEYSYAKNAGFPVAKVLNQAGYYVPPTAENVAVGLLGAKIDTNKSNPATYLTQKLDGVYANPDPRAYPLSSYSYMILPTAEGGTFTQDKGKTLSDFSYYFLCTGQQQADVLGYSPLPINLVQAGFEQVRRIPGADVQKIDVKGCNNPTFSTTGENTLAKNAPQPPACDKQGPYQCGTAAEKIPGTAGGTAAGGNGSGGGAGDAADAPAGSDGGNGTASSGGGGPGAEAAATDPALLAAGGVDVDGDGVAEPVAVDEFGEPIAGSSALGAAGAVSAMPVELASQRGWSRQHTLMLLTAVALALVTVGPPLLTRKLGSGR